MVNAKKTKISPQSVHKLKETQPQLQEIDIQKKKLADIFEEAPAFMAVLTGKNYVFEMVNTAYYQLVGHRDILGKPVLEALPEIKGQGYIELLDGVIATGKPFIGTEMKVLLQRQADSPSEERYVNLVYKAIEDVNGKRTGIFAHGYDVTDHVVARKRAQESEERYSTLINSMDEGFCILEMIFDKNNRPIDFRYIETNPVFEKQTGIKDPIGKTASQILPELEKHWFEKYGNVILTGESIRFTEHATVLDKWFDVFASRVGGDGSHKIALLFNDITERKYREMNVKFLATVQNDFTTFTTVVDITRTVSKRIADYLHLSHCMFNEINEEQDKAEVVYDYDTKNLTNHAGVYVLSEFHTEEECQQMASGKPIIIDDVYQDSRMAQAAENFDSLGIRSLINVPHISNGRWKFALSAQHDYAHKWRSDEIELLQELATRIYLRLERAKAEEAVRESEARFRVMADAAPNFVWMIDKDGAIKYMNKVGLAYFGTSLDKITQEDWAQYVHPEDIEEAGRLLQEAINNNTPYRFEHRIKRQDGQYWWVISTGNPIRFPSGESRGFIGSSVDITERKKAEEALQQQLQTTETITNNATACLFMIDQNGIVTFLNPAAKQVTGYTDEDAIGKPMHLLVHHSRPDGSSYPESECPLVQTYKHGKPNPLHEDIFFRKDGTPFPALIIGKPIPGADGIRGTVVEFRDITVEKWKEEERMRLERQKDEFLGVASHELKTPVTSIKAYTQVLQLAFQRQGDAKSVGLLAKMDGQINKLNTLIADLLDVTKIEAGKLHFREDYFDFNELVEEIVEEVQRTATRHKITLTLDKSKTVYGDRDRTGQVITNLLTNAIKYSPHADNVIVSTKADKKNITLCVQDFGVGIPEEKQAQVFERFYRVEGDKEDTYPGLGLGLYISSEIVRRQGGKLWVESELGKGSTFCFCLPIQKRKIHQQTDTIPMEGVKHG